MPYITKPCTNPVTKYGLRAFRSLQRKHILTEPVRQAKDSQLYKLNELNGNNMIRYIE